MSIFAFGVSGESVLVNLNCTRSLNALEVHGITASMKIQRWTNKKIVKFYYPALVNDNWFNFYFVFSFIE